MVSAVVHCEAEEHFRFVLNNGCASAVGENKGKGAVPGDATVSLDLATITRRRCCQGMLLILLTGIAFWGCERKQVHIPPEYNSPPGSLSYSAPEPAAPVVQQVPPVAQAPEVMSRERPASAPPPALKKLGDQSAQTVANRQDSEKLKKQEASKSPQRQASMQQVSQARGQLERGKPDAAIRTLEKAVRIDVRNGEAFILLARAWKQKGEKRKALEFAKKAELLYQKQPAKLKEVFLLESDLYRELVDAASAVQSGRKASTVHRSGGARSGQGQRGE